MAKSKTVVSVHIDIAKLAWATRSIDSVDDWATWGSTFVEALATNTPSLNMFAASLIKEVIDFRENEAIRVRELRKVQNVQVQSEHSEKRPIQTDRQTRQFRQSDKKEVKPTIADVAAYCTERKNSVDPVQWMAFYESNGWRVGKNPMKNWKAAVITWEKNSKGANHGKTRNQRLDDDAREFLHSEH